MMDSYNNAFTEVYEILNCLEEEELSKIPQNILKTIEENRNLNYEYQIDNGKTLKEQSMLIESKAILFNLFRDYLSTPKQKEKIIKMQHEERTKNEDKKREEYNPNNIFKDKIEKEGNIENDINLPIEVKKEKILKRLINYIRRLFISK